MRTRCRDGFCNGRAFVAGEIVHDDDVAGPERRHKKLLDPGLRRGRLQRGRYPRSWGRQSQEAPSCPPAAKRQQTLWFSSGREELCRPAARPSAPDPRLSPGQAPRRVMLVPAPVSSINTSRAGSSLLWSSLHFSRAAATSGLSCSAACRTFFISQLHALQIFPHRGTADDNPVSIQQLLQLRNCCVWCLHDQPPYCIAVRCQKGLLVAPELGRLILPVPV